MAKGKGKDTTALANWDEQLASLASQATKVEENVGVGAFISIKGGVLSYKSVPVPGNEMDVVVVHHILENDWYKGKYDPNNVESPACYAFGTDENTMGPNPEHPMEDQQSDKCNGCWANEYASADTGRGKACQNRRRIALITANDLEDVDAAEVAYIKIPPTSLKSWAGFVRDVAENMKRPPLGVIAKLKVQPDTKNQVRVDFTFVEKIDDSAVIEKLIKKNKKEQNAIAFPYIQIEKAAPARGNNRQQESRVQRRGGAQQPAAPAAPARGRGRR